MKYLSGKVGVHDSYEYAKIMINKILDIEEFTAFYAERTPYYKDYGIEKEYYNFIVKDSSGNEIWFDTNCGDEGTGPSCTEKILQLFGAREDYGIEKDKIVYKTGLELNHSINLLVLGYNRLNKKAKEIMFVKIVPNSARDRLKLVEGLENLGSIIPYTKKQTEYEDYFKETYNDKSLGEYKTNNLLYIGKYLQGIGSENLEKIIKTIIIRNIGEASEFEIKILQKIN